MGGMIKSFLKLKITFWGVMRFVALAYKKLLELSHLAIAFFDHLTRLPLDTLITR